MNQGLSTDRPEAGPHRYSTHEVRNQAEPATGFNAFTGDVVLRDAIDRGAPWAADRCAALGAVAGEEEVQELARLANRHLPELKTTTVSAIGSTGSISIRAGMS
jgi:putative acyl-CoA dehydrogenase